MRQQRSIKDNMVEERRRHRCLAGNLPCRQSADMHIVWCFPICKTCSCNPILRWVLTGTLRHALVPQFWSLAIFPVSAHAHLKRRNVFAMGFDKTPIFSVCVGLLQVCNLEQCFHPRDEYVIQGCRDIIKSCINDNNVFDSHPPIN